MAPCIAHGSTKADSNCSDKPTSQQSCHSHASNTLFSPLQDHHAHSTAAPSWSRGGSRRNSLSEMGVPVMRARLRALEKHGRSCHGVPTLRRLSLTCVTKRVAAPLTQPFVVFSAVKRDGSFYSSTGKIQGISWPISSTIDMFGPIFLLIWHTFTFRLCFRVTGGQDTRRDVLSQARRCLRRHPSRRKRWDGYRSLLVTHPAAAQVLEDPWEGQGPYSSLPASLRVVSTNLKPQCRRCHP